MNEFPRMSVRDTLARDRYLFRLDLLLAGMPNKKVAEIRKDLRIELARAAQDGEFRQALAGLGPVNVLASNYLEAHGRKVPRVWAGLVAFAVLLYGWLLGVISLIEGLYSAADQIRPDATVEVVRNWLFVQARVVAGPEGVDSIGFSLSGWGLLGWLAVLVIVPLICASVWRAWLPRPTADQAQRA
ncbi:hypothetical protein [Timonella senegalensis]|uniref:hypothetical protein n=1 Tax=Timonella senegalensis TaxID=1465825 RepID=UPI0002F19B06|nr:hypothetical protein [Timonella senegalensis]